MLAHRLRRWVNIKPTLVERPRVFLLRGIHVVMDHVQRRGGGGGGPCIESLWSPCGYSWHHEVFIMSSHWNVYVEILQIPKSTIHIYITCGLFFFCIISKFIDDIYDRYVERSVTLRVPGGVVSFGCMHPAQWPPPLGILKKTDCIGTKLTLLGEG